MNFLLGFIICSMLVLTWLMVVRIRDLEAELGWWQREARERLAEVKIYEAAEKERQRVSGAGFR